MQVYIICFGRIQNKKIVFCLKPRNKGEMEGGGKREEMEGGGEQTGYWEAMKGGEEK